MKHLTCLFCLLLLLASWPAGLVTAQSDSPAAVWQIYTNGNEIISLAQSSQAVWAGTSGGLVRWDRAGGGYTKYTTVDGLAGNEVRAVAAAPDGSMWAGTAYGLSRFDGQTWTTYTTVEGLADNQVYALALDGEGRLWVGTGGGVSIFDGQQWLTYTREDGLIDNRVQAIAFAPDGAAWLGTPLGLSRFDGQSWTPYQPEGYGYSNVAAIAIDSAGAVWVVFNWSSWPHCGGGVSVFNGQEWLKHKSGCGYQTVALEANRVWIGGEGGLEHFDGQTWQLITPDVAGLEDDSTLDDVQAVLADPAGQLWVGTRRGLHRLSGQQWTVYLTDDTLPSNYIQTLAAGPAGDVWLSAGVARLMRLENGQWTPLPSAADLPLADEIITDSTGQLWIGSPMGGVSRFDGQQWQTYTTETGFLDNNVLALAAGPGGSLWVGTNAGAAYFNGQQWQTYTTAAGLLENTVLAAAVDSQGRAWLGTPRGLSVFDGSTWTTYTIAEGLADSYVNALAVDQAGRVWVGSGRPSILGSAESFGLSMWDGNTWRSYGLADGLPESRVIALAVDAAGQVWVGSHAGVSVFDGTGFTSYTVADGLADNRVTAISFDAAGRAWLGTEHGVSILGQPLAAVPNGADTVEPGIFTTSTSTPADGLVNAGISAIAVTPDGSIWAGTTHGISRLQP